MAKRYTKKELADMDITDKVRAYNAMADEEGFATKQRKSSATLPTDLDDRLSAPAYKFVSPDSSIPLLRGATRSVSSKEIEAGKDRLKRIEKFAKERPGRTMFPSDLGYKKGGSVKSSASRRGDGIAKRGKTKGKMC
jgi:hypothetical protein